MGILIWIVFGLIVGVIAKLLMPGRDPGGCVMTILLGIAGSFLGGFMGRALGLYSENVSAGGIIMSIIGAVLLLILYRLVFGGRGTDR
ncbi:MAG: GlsB/YeaQ/YmgE family stress response membrane protein [Acidobacteriota bacterium]